jgi:homoserine O-succinyltransferase
MRAEFRSGRSTPEPRGEAIEIALVNNMPDQALATTQAQFKRLVRSGAGELTFRLRSYALSSMPRSETARRYLTQTHDDLAALYARGADALIVTGTEPRAADLREEPYWPEFARLVDWARDHTISSLWSCLAAHAAVLRLDGIERRRAARKLSGVYCFAATPSDWTTHSASDTVLVPHSRYNCLERAELERRGYVVASWSRAAGVDVFWRREPSVFLFLQGHPEYDADTLAREYRRDVLRFLARERDAHPGIPHGCFSAATIPLLDQLKARAVAGEREGLDAALDTTLARESSVAPWAEDATRLYRNWLALVAAGMVTNRRIA